MTTITATFTLVNGEPYASRKITLSPIIYPRIDGDKIIVGEPRTLMTDTDGTFTVAIESGDYSVKCYGIDKVTTFTIAVPDTSSVVNVADLIVPA
jgi:hypothetical protein